MAINDHTIDDVNGDSSDWIELYNAGATDIDLGGMYLTDDPLVPTRRQLPSGLVVPAGGYLLLWASDECIDRSPRFQAQRHRGGGGAL